MTRGRQRGGPTRASVKEQLLLGSMGFPTHYDELAAVIAEDTPCPACGSAMRYVGYLRRETGVSLSLCSSEACDYGIEI